MSIPSSKQYISTISKNNKNIGFYHKYKPYVIGFKNPNVARKVMYNMHPEPIFTLLTGNPREELDYNYNKHITIDNEAVLFIPKSEYRIFTLPEHNLYYLENVEYEEFIIYPYTKNIGIIIPYLLIDETDEEILFRSHTIDPIDSSYFLR